MTEVVVMMVCERNEDGNTARTNITFKSAAIDNGNARYQTENVDETRWSDNAGIMAIDPPLNVIMMMAKTQRGKKEDCFIFYPIPSLSSLFNHGDIS